MSRIITLILCLTVCSICHASPYEIQENIAFSPEDSVFTERPLDISYSRTLRIFEDVINPFNSDVIKDSEEKTPTYMNASSVALSFLVRHATNDVLDLVLLSDVDNETAKVNGLEVGIQPVQSFDFRVMLRGNDNSSQYGVELGIYPTKTAAVKFILEDNQTSSLTGVRLNLSL